MLTHDILTSKPGLQEALDQNLPTIQTLSPLAGDASNRRYVRLGLGQRHPHSAILMLLGPREAELLRDNHYMWTHVQKALKHRGLPVPKIHAELPEFGAIVLEDLGNTTLLDQVDQYSVNDQPEQALANCHNLYLSAIDHLTLWAQLPKDLANAWSNPAFTAEIFRQELIFCKQHFILPLIGKRWSAHLETSWNKGIEELSAKISLAPQCIAHRDFHARNLMCNDDQLTVIDFQDARLGPACYDLCSLIADPYSSLSIPTRKRLLETGLRRLRLDHPDMQSASSTDFWPWVCEQRLWKALGSFGFYGWTHKRPRYLNSVGPSLDLLEGWIRQVLPAHFLLDELLELVQEAWQGYEAGQRAKRE